MLVALAAKCLAGLATGLRKKFGQYAGHVSIMCSVFAFEFSVCRINCGMRNRLEFGTSLILISTEWMLNLPFIIFLANFLVDFVLLKQKNIQEDRKKCFLGVVWNKSFKNNKLFLKPVLARL